MYISKINLPRYKNTPIRTMDTDICSTDMELPNKSLIGKDLIFFQTEHLLKKVKVPDDIKLESSVQVLPGFYDQFARTTQPREYDDNFVLPDAPTIKLTSTKQPRKDSKRKARAGSLHSNDDEISIEIQKLFLKEKIAF